MLVVDGLRKGFGSGTNRLEVLNGVNMKLELGELVALMGPILLVDYYPLKAVQLL